MSYWGQLQGGAEYQLHLLGSELVKLGYRVYYIFIDQNIPTLNDEVRLVPLKVSKFSKKAFYPYQSLVFFDLQHELNRIKPDVIINRRGDALTGGCAHYAKSNSCTMIWHIADEPDVTPLKKKLNRSLPIAWLDKKLLEYGIRNTDYIVGQAHYQSALLEQHYHRACDVIIPNFHPISSENIYKSEKIKIVWIANIKEKKNPGIFVRLAKAFESSANVLFVMVGREGSQSLQNEINVLSEHAANFEYVGELSQYQVNNLLDESHIFVNTSSYEGFPNTFIQAWMRRMPVVSLNVDPDDVLFKNKMGYHSKTFEQLVADLATLINDPELVKEQGNRAYEYAISKHSMNSNINKFVSLIENPKH